MRKSHSLAFFLISILTACSTHFRDINTDQSGITDDDLQIDNNVYGIRLGIIQQGIYFNYDYGKGKNWPFQLIQNLNADMFSGYLHDAKPLNGGTHNSDYNLQDGWNGALWGHTYAYIFPQIHQLEGATREKHIGFFGITKVLKVAVGHRVTDYYGPIIYTHFGDPEKNYQPDSQKDAYLNFFLDLDTAVASISEYIELRPDASDFSRFDILLDGEYTSWIKYANALRMRLAIRLATADPVLAKKEFLKAFKQNAGVFDNENERVAVSTRDGYTNPLGEINRIWDEAYMNASMESILCGYEDPRKTVYFEPCTLPALHGQYRGIRQGTCFAHNRYSTLSKPIINQDTNPVLMSAAEVWFLRAEAALRGWTTEKPGVCYEKGIETSFLQHRVPDVETYLKSDKLAADFIDTEDAANNIKARCQVSPQWMEAADPEIKLEKIITQKWLAIFPEGCEAWAEQRRTGYPRLFPVRFNNSRNGCIDTEVMIRRLPFPGNLASENESQYQGLIDKLGAPDHAGTRLWWDTGRNF